MSISMKEIKTIRADLAKRKPARLVVDSDHQLSIKETILTLAPELCRMKSRGFTTSQVLDILNEHHISIRGATLNRYLNEYQTKRKLEVDASATDKLAE